MSAGGINGSGGGGLYDLARMQAEADEAAKKAGGKDPAENAKDADKSKNTKDAEAAAGAEAAAQAQAAQQTQNTQGPQSTDKVDNSTTSGVGGVRPGDGNAPIPTDCQAPPTNSPEENAQAGANICEDANMQIGAEEQNISVAYAKLMNQTKNDIDGLKQMIEDIGKAIDRLKDKADKLKELAAKIQELLPQFMAALDTDKQGVACRDPNQLNPAEQQLLDTLKQTMAELGISVKDGTMESLVNAIGAGGQAGMALAMALLMSFAEMIVDAKNGDFNKTPDAAQNELDPNDPELTPPTGDEVNGNGNLGLSDPNDPSNTIDPTVDPTLTDPSADIGANAAPTDPSLPPDSATGLQPGETVDPDTGLILDKPLNEADAFAARLENLAVFAQQYVDSNPYDGNFWLSTMFFGGEDPTSSTAQTGAALMCAVFSKDGTGMDPQWSLKTKDVASKKQGDMVNIEGFQIDMLQVTIASMMPKEMATAYIGGLIAKQLEGKLAEIGIAIKGLRALQVALKDLIKVLEKELLTLDGDKQKALNEIQKTKEKAMKGILKMIEDMKAAQAEMNGKLIGATSDACAGLFGLSGEILAAEASGTTTAGAPLR